MKLQHSDEYFAVRCYIHLERKIERIKKKKQFMSSLHDLMLDHALWFGRYFTFIVDRFVSRQFSRFVTNNLHLWSSEKLLKLLCPPKPQDGKVAMKRCFTREELKQISISVA